jgi:predicted nucleotidyltransferase
MTIRDIILTHRQEIIGLAARFGASNLRLFGSASRGDEAQDSDVDFLATVDGEKVSLWNIMDLESELVSIFHRPVHIISDRELPQRFRERIQDDLLPLERMS